MGTNVSDSLERVGQTGWRMVALSAIGPLTALAGVVWAIAQPYRVTLLDPGAYGAWDHVAQPPLLVILVGLFVHYAVARPLARTLEHES
jgi:hypothetical protein